MAKKQIKEISYFDYIKFMAKRFLWIALDYICQGIFFGVGFWCAFYLMMR